VIREVSIEVMIGDVQILFGEGIKLEVFNDSSGYEPWTMTGPSGQNLFSASGGEVCTF
jgi:hypothetical protein